MLHFVIAFPEFGLILVSRVSFPDQPAALASIKATPEFAQFELWEQTDIQNSGLTSVLLPVRPQKQEL